MKSLKFLILVAFIVALVAIPATASAQAQPTVVVNCFAQSDWNAGVSTLPCTTVTAPDNDRVRVIQGTTTEERAECIINYANVNDARCFRTQPLRAANSVRPIVFPSQPVRACDGHGDCAKIGKTQEDGSVSLVVQAGKVEVRCVLGNPVEEKGKYRMPCKALLG